MKNPLKEPLTQYQQLADYIKKNLAKGYTLDALKYSLMSQGYSRTSVDKAIDLANKQLAESAPKIKEKPQIKYQVIDQEELKKRIEKEEKLGFFQRLWKKIFR